MQTKRFIAGAVCPKCKAMDKIELMKTSTLQTIECVSCGYTDKQTFSSNSDMKGEK